MEIPLMTITPRSLDYAYYQWPTGVLPLRDLIHAKVSDGAVSCELDRLPLDDRSHLHRAMWTARPDGTERQRNPLATLLARIAGAIGPEDWITGTAVISDATPDGEPFGLAQGDAHRTIAEIDLHAASLQTRN
jgi:hypothetical protein